jgi:hypothetical protein
MMASDTSAGKSCVVKRCNGAQGGKTTKPRRPLTCYNIFFRYERAALIGEKVDPRSIIEGMYSNNSRPRRAHRKSHGKISFKALADHVSTAWRILSPGKKNIFQDLADEALQMYRTAVEEYEESLKDMKREDIDETCNTVRAKESIGSSSCEHLSRNVIDWSLSTKGPLSTKEKIESFMAGGRRSHDCLKPFAKQQPRGVDRIFPKTQDSTPSARSNQESSAVSSKPGVSMCHKQRLDYLVSMWGSIDPVPPGSNVVNVDYLLS